ncbi:phosphatase PAP2 family protein [Cupriavidus basilensis]|uniref:phosphatase PAP2 family protein n=1 Tax=Cupriavidus basilensis TaxID=68895 RepID=UPI0020A62DEB|nr:phosphatase PAP2 family protein [Cupriavidus basilensis]MCP3019164.1 phosphatase PAP2 family protein [Cupriavidus basilensis]
MIPWHLISRFGETSLLLPCAVLIAAWLFHAGAVASARRWVLSFGVTAAVVLASKLAFMGWGIGCAALNFTGFSGHSMMSASVLPVLLYLIVSARHPRLAVGAGGIGLLLALLVGVSRLKLQAHSGSEVLGGLALGFAVSLSFIFRGRRPARSAPALAAALVVVLMLGVPAVGVAAPTHHWLEILAARLAGRDKPFQRGQWREWAGQREGAAVLACLPPASPR